MYINSQNEVTKPHALAPVHPPSTSDISRPSSYQDGASSLAPDINSLGVDHLSDPLSNTRNRFANLTLTKQSHTSTNSDAERARRLKAKPTCKITKEIGLEAMGQWNRSFELTEQEHLLPDLPPLEALKRKTNSELIQTQFETLVEYSAGIKHCYDGFQALRRKFDDLASAERMTIDQQVEAVIKLGKELMKNKATLGKNSDIVLNGRSDVWKFLEESVKETQDKIKAVLLVQHDRQESVQFLDMHRDGGSLAVEIGGSSGSATTFFEGIGKHGLSNIAKRNKWLEIKMLQTAYEEEKSKTDALGDRLNESRDCLYGARALLMNLETEIYTDILLFVKKVNVDNVDSSFVAVANKLDEAEGKLLTLMELLEEFLARITEEYGGKVGTREVKRLCSRVPNIFTALTMLLSAKDVIEDDHKHVYEDHIYELCNTILEHFNVMQEIHSKCRSDVDRQAAFLRDDVPRFRNAVAPHLEGIRCIAEAHISKSKSKEAYNERAKEDRYHGNSTLARKGRPLVTSDEILWALDKVVDVIWLVQAVPSISAASNRDAGEDGIRMEETAINDSLPWLKVPDETINEFYAVLYDEIKKLETLKEKGERQVNARSQEHANEHRGRVSRLLRLLTRMKLH